MYCDRVIFSPQYDTNFFIVSQKSKCPGKVGKIMNLVNQRVW